MYYKEGNKKEAFTSLLSAIPGEKLVEWIGNGIKAIRSARKTARAAKQTAELASGVTSSMYKAGQKGIKAKLGDALSKRNKKKASKAIDTASDAIKDTEKRIIGLSNDLDNYDYNKAIKEYERIEEKFRKGSKRGSPSRYDRTGYQSNGRSNNLFGRDRSTRRTTNLTEWRRSISQQDIHNEMRLFLGDDYVKVDSGKWRSLDGTRQFRVKPDDYLGNHGIGQPTVPNTPHVHFEFLTPRSNGNGFDVIKNIHVPIK